MSRLAERHILLGVTGGIAAYKAAELARLLVGAGATVRVVMTAAAESFIGALTFQALTGERVHTSLLDPEAEAAMGHIELARWAEAIIIAPASADCLARLAQGRADDLLTTLVLASEAPLLLAPAMNHRMWTHPATAANVATLRARAACVIEPDDGEQACGEFGPGRLPAPEHLLESLAECFAPARLAGRQVVITAGPTHEALDPVRYLGNRSSGRMGFAVAAAAATAGARVTLISGPVALATPAGVERRIDVVDARAMEAAAQTHAPGCDLFIATAAVADRRPAEVSAEKIRTGDAPEATLSLVANPDILAGVCALASGRPYCVGFAAETTLEPTTVEAKRRAKGADLICANAVGDTTGFGDVDSTLALSWDGGSITLGPAAKPALARALIEHIADQLDGRAAGASA